MHEGEIEDVGGAAKGRVDAEGERVGVETDGESCKRLERAGMAYSMGFRSAIFERVVAASVGGLLVALLGTTGYPHGQQVALLAFLATMLT